MVQFFKYADQDELNVYDSIEPIVTTVESSINSFYIDAYNAPELGGIIHDNDLSPLTNAIRRDVFVACFQQIFSGWRRAGTFEVYIAVFKKIFGDDVGITFTVPNPGHLQIDLEANTGIENQFQAKQIESNQYVYYDLLDSDGDNLVFITPLGIESQYELEKVLYTLVPEGIYAEITLTIDIDE
jgi:hypothetical protein